MILLSVLLVVFFPSCWNSQEITVSTPLGNITGLSHSRYSTFFGIPYVETAPIGDNRFTLPSMKSTAYASNKLNASLFGAQCIQLDFLFTNEIQGEEDCLTLNIWTPNPTGNYSVIVWIHGGGFVIGSGSLSIYPGKSFANNNIVYVSINYRLGLFGFLPLNEIFLETSLTNGALNGIYDQIIALQWINNYIEYFGGNPNQITIFGESAGGASVCALLFAPIAMNLFNKAIIQSGGCNGAWGFIDKSIGETNAQSLLIANNITNHSLTSLRSLPASQLSAISFSWPFASIDGYIAIYPYHNLLNNSVSNISSLNAKDIIIGVNSMDTLFAWPWYPFGSFGTLPQTPFPTNDYELKQILNGYFDTTGDTFYNDIISNYFIPDSFGPFDKFNNWENLWLSMSTDVCLTCPMLWFAEWFDDAEFSANNDYNIYLYHLFDSVDPYYTSHSGELPFVFNDSSLDEFLLVTWNPSIANNMHNVWINFAKDVNVGNIQRYYGTENEQKITIFGGPLGITNIVNNYYGQYHGGFCKYLKYEIQVHQNNLCLQNLKLNISTKAPTLSPTLSPILSPTFSPSSISPTLSPILSPTFSPSSISPIQRNKIALISVLFILLLVY